MVHRRWGRTAQIVCTHLPPRTRIKRFSSNNDPPARPRGQQCPQLAHWVRSTLPGSQNYVKPHGNPPRLLPHVSPNTDTPRGKGDNNTHNSHKVPYLNFDFGVGWPGVRTTFSHMATSHVLYVRVSRLNKFSPNTYHAGSVPSGPFYNTHTVLSLKFAWLSRGVPLLGPPGTSLLCPFTPWDEIKRIFPEYWPSPPLPRGAKGATILTTRTQPELWLRARLPGFLVKTNIPRILTLLQFQPSLVHELCLALPWCTSDGGSRHRSPVSIYPLGLDKTNFSRILTPRWSKSATMPTTRTRSRTWTLKILRFVLVY